MRTLFKIFGFAPRRWRRPRVRSAVRVTLLHSGGRPDLRMVLTSSEYDLLCLAYSLECSSVTFEHGLIDNVPFTIDLEAVIGIETKPVEVLGR